MTSRSPTMPRRRPRSSRSAFRFSSGRPPPRSSGAARRWFPALFAWRSTDVAGVFLQQRPGFITELGLCVLVKGRLGQRRLECLRLGRVEGQPVGLKALAVVCIGLDDVFALLDCGGIEMLL